MNERFNDLYKFCYAGKHYLEWQNDDYCRVGFSEIPKICNKEINKKIMSKCEIKRAKEKPLFLADEIEVYLSDKRSDDFYDDVYTFKIPAGYDYDGASIPRVLWRVIGSKENIEFKIAALIHDFLCENKNIVEYDRYFADKIFERLLEVSGVGAFKRWLMFHSVDNYQKFCGWEKEKKNDEIYSRFI